MVDLSYMKYFADLECLVFSVVFSVNNVEDRGEVLIQTYSVSSTIWSTASLRVHTAKLQKPSRIYSTHKTDTEEKQN